MIILKCSHFSKLRCWQFDIHLSENEISDIDRMKQLITNVRNQNDSLKKDIFDLKAKMEKISISNLSTIDLDPNWEVDSEDGLIKPQGFCEQFVFI